MLAKRELKILEENGWLVTCESPFEMEKDNGFNPPNVIFSVEEAKEEVKALVISKAHYKNLHEKEQKKKLKAKEKAKQELKRNIELILYRGVTVDRLFELYTNCCNFGFKFNPHSKELKELFKEITERNERNDNNEW